MLRLGAIALGLSLMCTFPTSALASHPTPEIYGTIQQRMCDIIDGTRVTESVDSNHSQFIEVCRLDDGRNFRIIRAFYGGCIEAEGAWRDPITNRTYTFPDPCSPPTTCAHTPQFAEAAVLTVNHKGSSHNITALSTGLNCEFDMDIPQNKITMALSGRSNSTSFVEVAIPYQFLLGNYTVLVNGNISRFVVREPSLGDIPDTSKYEEHRAKYYDSGSFERIIALINSGVTRSINIIFYGGDKDRTVELLGQYNVTNISKGNNLSFVIADVPVRAIPEIVAHDYVGVIGFGSTTGIETSVPETIIRSNFTFPESASGKSDVRVEIIGTQVVPEFPLHYASLLIIPFATVALMLSKLRQWVRILLRKS
jgi:hypothetical protein